MAGNILYIPYTLFIIIGLIILMVVIKFKKGKSTARKFLIYSIPIFILTQIYFWNLEVNNYVKSYLFSDKVFKCEYEAELKNISIPLPERTVFKGKENSCSPFYSTYINAEKFKSFYQEELNKMMIDGEIQRFSYFANRENDGTDNKGYVVELLSGSEIDIFIDIREGSSSIEISYELLFLK